jgi:predicted transcriptional regulator
MTPPGQSFATNVAELRRYADQLPQVAEALRRPVATLTEHTATARPLEVAAVSGVERTYGALTEDIAARQRTMCDRITATAEALGEIAAVYRRVDGQG